MRLIFHLFLKYTQYILLISSYYVCSLFKNKYKKINWVIGVDEIAKVIFLLNNLLPNSFTVSFSKNRFYTLEYNFYNKIKNIYISYLYKAFMGPVLLGYLMHRSDKFLYIWSTGFLINRELEFKFLKSKNKKLVCMFVGSDIRSLKLRKELYLKLEMDGSANYIKINNHDEYVRDVARIADLYADVIFSASVDQISYLTSKQYYPRLYYNKDYFNYNENKFNTTNRIKILHAASNPIIKGTQLVRAAIKKLELEGYIFEYIEMQNVDNTIVLEQLKSTHIVLNEFYAFGLGVLTIEAMANRCAILTSSDPKIEIGLPQNENDAWFITPYWEIYDNLKYLLDNPNKIKYYADNGYKYANKYFTFKAVNKYMNDIFKENGIID